MAKVRMHIEMSKDLDDELEALARSEGVTKSEMLRRGLSVIKAFKEQAKRGRTHLGFVEDSTKLNAEMLGILNNTKVA